MRYTRLKLLYCLILFSTPLNAVVEVPDPDIEFSGYAWQVTRDLDHPSFVYYHPEKDQLFVANVQGSALTKDSGGWIDIYSIDGQLLKQKWATGLDAPRGMVAVGSVLWVADLDKLVRFDLESGQRQNAVVLPDAKLLSGIDVDANGRIFAADPLGEKIFLVDQEGARVFVEGAHLERPSDLIVVGSDLIISGFGNAGDSTAKGHLYRMNIYSGLKRLISSAPIGHLSGVAIDHLGFYLVSDWLNGKVFRVSRSGGSRILYEGLKGAGGIAFIAQVRRLVVPRSELDALAGFDLDRHPDL